MLICANSCYFTSAEQQVKQLDSDALSGRNSLSRKQMKAGSLANLIPSSQFEVSEMGEAIPICEYLCPLEKNHLLVILAGNIADYVKGIEIVII